MIQMATDKKKKRKEKIKTNDICEITNTYLTYNQSQRSRSGAKELFEEVWKNNFLELMKSINPQTQDTKPATGKINSKNKSLKYIIIKFLRTRERNLKAVG